MQTHTLASVEPPSCSDYGRNWKPGQLRIVSILGIFTRSSLAELSQVVLPSCLGTQGLTRVPRIQVCCPTAHDALDLIQHYKNQAGLDFTAILKPGTFMAETSSLLLVGNLLIRSKFIPVVTFLAPLHGEPP